MITLPTLAALALGAALPAGSESDLAVAWLRDGRVETRAVAPAAVTDQAPLGSVWKLFVYAYLVERGQETPAYRCEIPRRPGDEYCCEPGQSVERDAALARSCATFFAPSRLKIEPSEWHAFWSTRVGARAAWLSDLQRLQPHTIVPVPELLQALAAVPPVARTAASRALLPVLLDGYGQGAVRHLGGSVRVKTFTWPHPRQQGASIGGGAGWLIDGTPVWFSARGASRTVLTRDAAQLSATLPAPSRAPEDEPCVVVDYFERYPIRQVDEMTSRTPAAPGPLRGRHRVTFENGNTLVFQASGEMRLDRDGARPRLRARLPLSEYVARVLDREADPGPTQAARALAVVARTWLVRNAVFESGCFQVADSTRAQRVSASPASSGGEGGSPLHRRPGAERAGRSISSRHGRARRPLVAAGGRAGPRRASPSTRSSRTPSPAPRSPRSPVSRSAGACPTSRTGSRARRCAGGGPSPASPASRRPRNRPRCAAWTTAARTSTARACASTCAAGAAATSA